MLCDAGVCAFWNLKFNLNFSVKPGLHKGNSPVVKNHIKLNNFKLIHKGFSTDYQIMRKFNTYMERDPRIKVYKRLLDERNLNVKELDLVPTWSIKNTINPKKHEKIINIYNRKFNKNIIL